MRALYAALLVVVACSSPLMSAPPLAPPIAPRPAFAVDMWLDGSPFRPRTCSAGATSGFLGFDLTGEDGTRVRIASELDGSSKIVVFRPGADVGITLIGCSRAEMKESRGRSSSTVHGRASMKCEAPGIRLEGTVLYDRC